MLQNRLFQKVELTSTVDLFGKRWGKSFFESGCFCWALKFLLSYGLDRKCSPKVHMLSGCIWKEYEPLEEGPSGRLVGLWGHVLEENCGTLDYLLSLWFFG